LYVFAARPHHGLDNEFTKDVFFKWTNEDARYGRRVSAIPLPAAREEP